MQDGENIGRKDAFSLVATRPNTHSIQDSATRLSDRSGTCYMYKKTQTYAVVFAKQGANAKMCFR